MEEIWRPVVGYEGLYEVSNYGNVRSVDRYVAYSDGRKIFNKGKILKPSNGGGNYLFVCLYNGKKTIHLVHRLVAKSFLPNPDNLPVVNHKDCNTLNNIADNLEWCTQQYNATYANAVEKRSKYSMKPVNMISKNGEIVKKFKSVTEAGNYFNPKGRSGLCLISLVLRGKAKSAYGYKWEWA